MSTYNKIFESGKARELLIDEPRVYMYYVQLMSYRNKDTYLCCPSYETLMEACHIGSKATITKFNKRLKELGLIYWVNYRVRENGKFKNRIKYFFPQDALPYYPPSKETLKYYNKINEEYKKDFEETIPNNPQNNPQGLKKDSTPQSVLEQPV